MAPSKAQIKKAADQAALKEIKTITVTIRASEFNLQRLAAFMLFCEHLEPIVEVGGPELPMPWEDPTDPRFVPDPAKPALEIDYALVRRDITKELERLGAGSRAAIIAAINTNGGTRISDVPEDNLLSLLSDLNRLNPETAA